MTYPASHDTPGAQGAEAFLDTLADLVPALALEADRDDGFPAASLGRLRELGALTAPLPATMGGFDLGCGRQGANTARFMRLLGRASVSLGRLLEGHVNALRLVCRYGTDDQMEEAAAAAREGHLFAIWVTDSERPLIVREGVLLGGKAFCSGAGHVGRALVTAQTTESATTENATTGGATGMFVVPVSGVPPLRPRTMSGVRGAVTADVALDGTVADSALGEPGDYLRQPEFSAGAWRGSAVACGVLEALTDAMVDALAARGRQRAPHQSARIGRVLIARDTARLWVGRAAEAADGADPGCIVATVNLARIAVEMACLDAIPLVQRSVGLNAFLSGSRIERLLRDLATYLRQPAPDETLEQAAAWFADAGGAAAP